MTPWLIQTRATLQCTGKTIQSLVDSLWKDPAVIPAPQEDPKNFDWKESPILRSQFEGIAEMEDAQELNAIAEGEYDVDE